MVPDANQWWLDDWVGNGPLDLLERLAGENDGNQRSTISVVRSSAPPSVSGAPPSREKFLPGRVMPSEGICVGDTHITGMEGPGGRVRYKANARGRNLAARPVQLDDPKRGVDPRKGSLSGRS